MNTTTVLVAGMGFGATLLAAWLTGLLQRRTARDERILDAKVRVFGECSASLFEYQRVAYDRVKGRLESRPESHREKARQETYRYASRSRSAIGQVGILTRDEDLHSALDRARKTISRYSEATNESDLKRRQESALRALDEALEGARKDLTKRLAK